MGGVGQAVADAEGKIRLGHPTILPYCREQPFRFP